MPSERRLARINEVIRRVISERILEGGNFPSDVFLTVNRVKISGNLEWVDVAVSVYPETRSAKALQFLERERVAFQAAINKALQARRTPKIRFELDQMLTQVDEIIS